MGGGATVEKNVAAGVGIDGARKEGYVYGHLFIPTCPGGFQ